MIKKETLTKNDVIELEITDFTSEGSGVGHKNGMAVFVAGAAPGDTVECVIIKTKNNYAVGKITNVVKASPDRVTPVSGCGKRRTAPYGLLRTVFPPCYRL